MKTLYRLLKLSACFSVLIFAACSSGDGGDSSSTSRAVDSDSTTPTGTETTLSGVVADGYLRDARVFLDRNGNRSYDNGEPTVQSGVGGLYSFAVNPGEGDLYPVVVEVIAGQTVDEDTGIPVTEGYLMESPPGHWEFISPLTTLVKIERDKNPSLSEQQAVLNVRSQLGVADEVPIFSDYLDTQALTGLLAEEYSRTHRAAQVVANLMGLLRTEILLNLGGQIAAEEQVLVAYIISDQIQEQAEMIKQALDDERNLGVSIETTTLVSSVSAEINTGALNADLLAFYQQRIDQGLEYWDMQPPQLLTQYPPPGDNAPVNAVVSVVFDELLDETLLNSETINVSGPGGSISGQLNFDAEQKTLSFVPDQVLLPFSDYQITLSGHLADSLGNPLGEDVSWTFATIFDQTPPLLPDF